MKVYKLFQVFREAQGSGAQSFEGRAAVFHGHVAACDSRGTLRPISAGGSAIITQTSRRLFRLELIGAVFMIVLGSALHFAFGWVGGWRPLALVGPLSLRRSVPRRRRHLGVGVEQQRRFPQRRLRARPEKS